MKPMSFSGMLAQVLRDERGSISMEFVIVMPLLLFLTTNGLAFWDAFQSKSKTAKIAFTISEIMSRHDTVDNTDMAFLFGVQDKMLEPQLDQRTLRITSICFEDDLYRVMWSYTASGNDISPPPPLTDADIPVAMMPTLAPQESIILTETGVHWAPHLQVGVSEKSWNSVLIASPRFVNIIPHATLNPSNICPSAP